MAEDFLISIISIDPINFINCMHRSRDAVSLATTNSVHFKLLKHAITATYYFKYVLFVYFEIIIIN